MNIPETTSFYEDLISQYTQINFPARYEEIGKINKHIAWYLADSNNYFVTAKQKQNTQILDLDIKSAFTTICNNLFPKESEFIQKMNEIDDKKGRNIFIATTLKGEHLKILNYICKIVIFGIVFDTLKETDKENTAVLELKKDGILISCSEETFSRLQDLEHCGGDFTRRLLDKHFQFHTTSYNKYVRSNRTSLFFADEQLNIKGNYKYFPKKTKEIITASFSGKPKSSDELKKHKDDLLRLKKFYTDEVWNLVKSQSLHETLDNYFICENGKVIDESGKYVKLSMSTEIDPRFYLKIFVFPSILLNKIE